MDVSRQAEFGNYWSQVKEFSRSLYVSRQEIDHLKSKCAATVRDFFTGMAGQLCVHMPEVKSISWMQYTPYFNDGDPCVFSSGHTWCGINAVSGYCEDEIKLPETLTKEERDIIVNIVRQFMQMFSDEDMRLMFGDHAQVTITAGGIEVANIEHD